MATIGWGTTGADTDLTWVDNSTLSGTRLLTETVLLNWDEPDVAADTFLLQRWNAKSGAYATNETVTCEGASTQTLKAFIGAGGSITGGANALNLAVSHVRPSYWYHSAGAAQGGAQDWGFRFFFRFNAALGTYQKLIRNANGSWDITVFASGSMNVTINGNSVSLGAGSIVTGTWYELVVHCDNTTSHLFGVWLNGTWIGSNTYSAPAYISYPNSGSNLVFLNLINSDASAPTTGDGLELWLSARHTADLGSAISPRLFYPASGTVVTANNTLEGTLEEISWFSTESGDNEGDVSTVEVWTSGSWQAIGGASPSSPITGLSLPVVAGNLLRFTLAANVDTLKTETPILTWAQATIGATGGIVVPYPILASSRRRAF